MSSLSMSWLLSCAVRAALLLAASWLGAVLLRRGTAAARHQIWTFGVIGALLLPLMCWVLSSSTSATTTIASTGSLVGPAVLVTPGVAPSAAPIWPTCLAIVWTAGALVVGLRVLRAQLSARRIAERAESNAGESWSSALREATASVAIARRIELLRSESVGSPMTVGVLRPRVILPVAADGWSRERLRAVLLHELGHVRRRDTLVQLVAQVACALYWWNPLVWFAAARLRIEREHACDDLVLGSGILPSSYAADLLEVARSLSIESHAGAICMADSSSTDTRLRRILDATAQRRPLRARFRLAASALTLACAALLAITSSSPSSQTVAVHGTLSIGAPFVRDPYPYGAPVSHGAVDLSLVATAVKARLGELEHCYERRLAVDPTLAGTVVIHWTIDETGRVPEACITEDTVGDQSIVDCVNKLVREGVFPAPRGGAVDVSFPFVFARTAVATR